MGSTHSGLHMASDRRFMDSGNVLEYPYKSFRATVAIPNQNIHENKRI